MSPELKLLLVKEEVICVKRVMKISQYDHISILHNIYLLGGFGAHISQITGDKCVKSRWGAIFV